MSVTQGYDAGAHIKTSVSVNRRRAMNRLADRLTRAHLRGIVSLSPHAPMLVPSHQSVDVAINPCVRRGRHNCSSTSGEASSQRVARESRA